MKIELPCRRELNSEGSKGTKNRPQLHLNAAWRAKLRENIAQDAKFGKFGPKTEQEALQDRAKFVQEASKGVSRASKSAPRARKKAPRGPKGSGWPRSMGDRIQSDAQFGGMTEASGGGGRR